MDINRAAEEAAARIAYAFTRSGLSKKKLAEMTGIPYATLDRRFRNGHGWTMREVIAVADALGMSAAEFLADSRAMEKAAA